MPKDEELEIPKVVTQEEFDKFTGFEKRFYKKDGDKYKFKYESEDDIKNLKSAKDKETLENKNLREALEKSSAELERIKKMSSTTASDLEKAEADKLMVKKQIEELQRTIKEKEEKNRAKLQKALIDKTAAEVAAIFKSQKAGAAFAKERISTEFDENDEPNVVFLDERGKKTTMNIEDFKKNIIADPDFKDILKGVDSSGGGANRTKDSSMVSADEFANMTLTEKTAFYRRDPQGYALAESKYKSNKK